MGIDGRVIGHSRVSVRPVEVSRVCFEFVNTLKVISAYRYYL
jgi:hypothetical protein